MRQLISYHTLTGDILSSKSKDVDGVVVGSGFGSSSEDILSSPEFHGLAQVDDLCDLAWGDWRMRVKVTKILSGTTCLVNISMPEMQRCSFKIVRHLPAAKYTINERDGFLAEIRTSVGHDDVGVLCLTTDRLIHAGSHFVDVSDSNKVKPRADKIEYE